MGALHRCRLTASDGNDTDACSILAGRSMPRIVIGDGALYYERQGIGFPVMFVSGLAGFASFWQDQVAAFAKNFDVITHDHRGIGQSDLTRSGFTVDRMAADVIGLMDALEIERAHIVGHSTGGAIAPSLPIRAPQRLASAALSRPRAQTPTHLLRRAGSAVTQGGAREFPRPVPPFLAPPTPG